MIKKFLFIIGACVTGIIAFFCFFKPIKDNLLICNISYDIEGDPQFNHCTDNISRNEGCGCFPIVKRNNKYGYTLVVAKTDWDNHNCEPYYTFYDKAFEIDGKSVFCTSVIRGDNEKSSSMEVINVVYKLYYDENGEIQCEIRGDGYINTEIRTYNRKDPDYSEVFCTLYK